MQKKFFLISILLVVCLLWLVGCAGHAVAFRTEHIALDVSSPEKTAEWWCENLGYEVVVKQTAPPFAIFIRDGQGAFAVELYRAANIQQAPDYHQMNPQQFHIAFVSANIDDDLARLVTAGATFISRQTNNGSELIMLRDPSGIPIQLVQRDIPVLK